MRTLTAIGAATAIVCVAGCSQVSEVQQFESAVIVHTSVLNSVALAVEEHRMGLDEARNIRDAGKVVSALLEAWAASIASGQEFKFQAALNTAIDRVIQMKLEALHEQN
jgi:flagellar hook-basal body complex protein FliE